MRMRGAGEVFGAGGEGDGGGGFGDEVAGAGPDDVDPEEAVGGFVGQDFDATVGLAEGQGAAVGAKGENAFAIFDAGRPEVFFGFADRSDFGMGVHDAGNGIVIDVTVAGDKMFDAGDTFFLRFVRQHRAADDIADGEDAGGGGGEVIVNGDAAFVVELDVHGFEAELLRVGLAADGHQDAVADDGFGAFGFDDAIGAFDEGGTDFGSEAEFQALLLE